MKCGICKDKNAVVKDGICTCPAGQRMDADGFCQTCGVPGCKNCAGDDCIDCTDDSAVLINGTCTCPKQNETINFFGYCSLCLVQGCDECTWSATECHVCKDDSATLIDGKCICSNDKPMNNEGVCQECKVPFCSDCVTGDKN